MKDYTWLFTTEYEDKLGSVAKDYIESEYSKEDVLETKKQLIESLSKINFDKIRAEIEKQAKIFIKDNFE